MKSGTKQTIFTTPLHFGGNYCIYDLQAKEFTKTKFKGLHFIVGNMSLKYQNC